MCLSPLERFFSSFCGHGSGCGISVRVHVCGRVRFLYVSLSMQVWFVIEWESLLNFCEIGSFCLGFTITWLNLPEGLFQPELIIRVYSPSRCSKPVCLSVSCGTQKNIWVYFVHEVKVESIVVLDRLPLDLWAKTLSLQNMFDRTCLGEVRQSYRFGTTWGWVNNEKNWHFCLNYPFKNLHLQSTSRNDDTTISRNVHTHWIGNTVYIYIEYLTERLNWFLPQGLRYGVACMCSCVYVCFCVVCTEGFGGRLRFRQQLTCASSLTCY